MVYSSSLRPRKILGAQLKQSGVIGDLILWPKLVHQNASFCLNHLWKRNCVYHIIYHSSHLFLSVCLICLQYFYSLAVWVLFFYAYILCMYLCMYIYIFMCSNVFNLQMISEGFPRLPTGWRFCTWLMTPLQDNEIFEALREASLLKTSHEQVAGHESDGGRLSGTDFF